MLAHRVRTNTGALKGACLRLAHIQAHWYIAGDSLAPRATADKSSSRVPACCSHRYSRTHTSPAAHSLGIWPLLRRSSTMLAWCSHGYKRTRQRPRLTHVAYGGCQGAARSRVLAYCSHRFIRTGASPAAQSHGVWPLMRHEGARLQLAHTQTHPYVACGSLASRLAADKEQLDRNRPLLEQIQPRSHIACGSLACKRPLTSSWMVLACYSHTYSRTHTSPAAHSRRV